MYISIKDSNITIYEKEDKVEKAKSDLLSRMYYARDKETMGGYDGWLKLLDLYFKQEYEAMLETIRAFSGKGGATRAACCRYLETIIKEG